MPEIRDVYLLSSPMSLPEGVAFDGRTRRFFATGLLGGQITQIDAATGEERVFFTSEAPLQFSGAKVDEVHRRLWVCASDIRGPKGGLHLFDVDIPGRDEAYRESANNRPGNEIEHPMAVVIIGGLLSSTSLNLLLMPVLYSAYGRPR